MQIKIFMTNVKEVEVEKNGKMLRLHHGFVRIMIDGYVMSDRFEQWMGTPLRWFLSFMFDNYFFKPHYEKFEDWCKSDVDDLYQKVKSYLNVFKYTYQQK